MHAFLNSCRVLSAGRHAIGSAGRHAVGSAGRHAVGLTDISRGLREPEPQRPRLSAIAQLLPKRSSINGTRPGGSGTSGL